MKDEKKWEFLIKKYPERAGIAWELYQRDKKKEANPTTYFNFAKKRINEIESRYQSGLRKWIGKKPTMENET